jgi:hypothetical protein
LGKITLGGSIPGDNNDGLGPSSKEFLDEPLRLVNVVARVAVSKITEKPETQERYPTLRIHHWEIVPDDMQETFGGIIGTAFGRRTGFHEPDQLPFPDGEVPLHDPFPEEASTAGEGGGDDDELAAPRRARRSG